MEEIPARLDVDAAAKLLLNPEASAFPLLVAACAIIGDEAITDEDGQPPSEEELELFLGAEGVRAHRDCLTKIVGLLMAVSGDEFFEDPGIFHRMASAMVDGDPFGREDDGDDLTASDCFWAIYQVGLVADEEEPLDELSERVKGFIEELADEEAEDLDGLAEEMIQEGEDIESIAPYYESLLLLRRNLMAMDLIKLKCDPEWIEGMDPELAGIMRGLKDQS